MLNFFLFPLGVLYVLLNFFRRKLYERGFFKSISFPFPVVSVGNLTMGGSGKTPFCIYLAKLLEEKGLKVAIVLRGYKRKTTGAMIVNKESTVEEVGEEALIYKRNLKCQVVVSEKREEALNVLEYPPDIVILDDGFQHLRVKRDFEIVLIDGDKNNDLLPYPLGKLREPISSLKKANLIIVTKTEEEKIPEKIEKYSENITTLFAKFDWDKVLLPSNILIELLQAKRVLLLLGIGNPFFFQKQAESKNLNIVKKIILKDHAYPNQNILRKTLLEFKKNKCDFILTSEKDYIKWENFEEIREKLLYPKLLLNLIDKENKLETLFSIFEKNEQ